MAKIVVNTDELRAAGNTMTDLASQFQSEYRAMLDAAENTKQGWQAEDNDAFIAKVVGLQDDFARLYQAIMGCGTDMKEAAQRYEQAVSENKSKASALAADIN